MKLYFPFLRLSCFMMIYSEVPEIFFYLFTLQDHESHKDFTTEICAHSFFGEVESLNGFWELVRLPYYKKKKFLAWHFVVAGLKRKKN